MSETRRDFLKFIVTGSVLAGCPIDLSTLSPAEIAAPQVDGEHFDICHQVRDGYVFQHPPVSERHDVVIVGGGVSGMSAAYFLRSFDFLLLEKEPHWGGNAYLETYEGQAFATGSAFDEKNTASDRLARELGLDPLPIDSPDPTIVGGKWIADTWRTGLDELPYPASVRESFKKFRKQMLALDPEKDAAHLDSIPLTNYLRDCAPEVTAWWDAYGPSNWGAKAADTSVLVAASDLHQMAGDDPDPRVTLPGGNGALAQQLAEVLHQKFAGQMQAGATTVGVEPAKDEVRVTFMQNGQLRTVAAKFVVMATPKFITARLVSDLREDQYDAMTSIRYCPYPVINMIFDRPVYKKAYDTWCPGLSFTDIVVADWVSLKQPQYRQKNNILTFYTPMAISQRKELLHEDSCRKIASTVLADFQKLLPEFAVDPIEVRLYRRGHPMFMATPGNFTRTLPAASRAMERVFFANTDSIAPVSDIGAAVEVAQRAAEWVEKRIKG
ncbi:MAG TPA: FAD-dependent oxidoreductase [Candidatus Limnocylindrales bacterium]|nr:FAD-dependent oxidoreductase [Candidatus Limnocylindrales bacterium]